MTSLWSFTFNLAVGCALWICIAVGAFSIALAGGCAHLPKSAYVQVGRDVLTCAADDAEQVRRALISGGWDWLTLVIDAIRCVPQVVRDLEMAPAVADASGTVVTLPPTLSKRARARIATAKILADVVLSRIAP